MTNEVDSKKPTQGVLMLFIGDQVPGPKGTWAKYFHGGAQLPELEPTYGSQEDVERWISEGYEIEPELLTNFVDQLKQNPERGGVISSRITKTQ